MKLDSLIAGLQTVVACARTGAYGDASSNINLCSQDLLTYLRSTPPDAQLLRKISYSLETLLMMQQTKDWVAVADVVEYELIALLRQSAP